MKRPNVISVRLTDDEHRRVAAYALKAERPLSDFIRRVLLDHMVDLDVEAIKPFLTQEAPAPATPQEPKTDDPSKPRSNRVKRPEGTPAPVFNFDATSTNTPICPECFSTDTVFDWELDGDKFYKCLSCEAKNF